MKNMLQAALSLLGIWFISFLFLLGVLRDFSYFLPTFAVLLSGIGMLISPFRTVRSFFFEIRIGRVFYSIIGLSVFAIFGGGLDNPNFSVVPAIFGFFLLISAITDRVDRRGDVEKS